MQCSWCEQSATVEREIAPAVLEPKSEKVKKAAVTVWVCPTHSAMIDREQQCREIEAAIHKIDLKLGKLLPSELKPESWVRQREELRGQLYELQGRVGA